MHHELPEHLLATRDVLTRSLPSHPAEKAPAIPPDLAAELVSRFIPEAARARETKRISPYAMLRNFLANPAFGVAAAAIALLAVAVPSLPLGKKSRAESFRGGETAAAAGGQIRVFFIGGDGSARSGVEASGLFEPSALAGAPNADAARKEKGPKVIVDFTLGNMTAYREDGSEASRAALPAATEDLAGELARAVSGL